MSYTPEMKRAERNFKDALRAWKIVQEENPEIGVGVFIDTDTQQNGAVEPTRMEYVRSGDHVEVTRISQGSELIYGLDAHGVCNDSIMDLNDFFARQPQMEAVFNSVQPAMSIPFNNCAHIAR